MSPKNNICGHEFPMWFKRNFGVIGRATLLLFMGYVITFSLFWHIKDITEIRHVVYNSPQSQNKEPNFIEQQDGEFEKVVEDLSSFVKIPIRLLYVGIYAQNYRQVEASSSERYPVLLNIDIKGSYNHAIKFGETRKIYDSIRVAKISHLSFIRSLAFEKPKEQNASTTPVVGSFYSLFIWPTFGSFIFIYFVIGVPLAYASLVIVDKCRRFIRFGSPFTYT
ncbi:MAG: hypothetical protein HY617_02650 [Candidatus Sungbacteria bacterium]|nr:hypothetical protein [Candidatus Sungbacteria bacterium]